MRVVLVLCVVAVLSLSGCASGRASPPSEPAASGADAAQHGLRGTVVDEERLPVVGAHVELLESGQSTRTDEAGAFELRGLGEGAFRLAAQKIGYAPTVLSVRVPHEEPITLELRQAAIDGEAYLETIIEKGYIDCAIGVGVAGHRVTSSGTCLNTGEHRNSFEWRPKEGLRTVLGELAWNVTSALNSATMDLTLHQGWSCTAAVCESKQTWSQEGTSILRLRQDFPEPGPPVEANVWRVRPPTRSDALPSVVLVIAQPFTLYTTTAYGEQAPSDLVVAQ